MSSWTVNVQGFPTVLVISRGQALTTKEPFAHCGDKVLNLKCWLSWAGGGKINGHQPRGKSGLWLLRALVGETFPQWKREHTLRPSIHPMARHPVEHVWVPCSGPIANLYLYSVVIESRPTHHTFYRKFNCCDTSFSKRVNCIFINNICILLEITSIIVTESIKLHKKTRYAQGYF